MRGRNHQRGMSFAEVMMSLAIVGLLIYAVANVTSVGMRQTKINTDRQFATQKAISMLEELKSLVQVNTAGSINVLDNYHDGSAFRDRLTTIGLLTDPPDEAVSGNVAATASAAVKSWIYSRQISVAPLQDPSNASLIVSSSDVRLVRVRVYKNLYGPTGITGRQLLAEVASVVRTLAVSFPTTQVYDVYCVAVENVPGWWVNMGSLVPFVQAAVNDLQNRHPGLEFRQRWITHLSYGRDTQYTPFINTQNSTLTPIPWTYFYPGLLPTSYTLERGGVVSPPAQFYYPPGNFDARMRTETGLMNPQSAAFNPFPYALADQYNHAMRYPDELALYNQRVNAVDGSGNPIYPNEQPTLRLLLEDMYQRPNQYLNALFINLHGEALPFPPIRNYSDPAKKPDWFTGTIAVPAGGIGTTPAPPAGQFAEPPVVFDSHNGVRAVTHPENLAYDTTAAPGASVNLRVYSYLTDPDAIITQPNAASQQQAISSPNCTAVNGHCVHGRKNSEWLDEPITVIIRGVNWTPGAAAGNRVVAISGGVDFNTTVWASPNAPGAGPSAPAPPYSTRDPYGVVAPAPTADVGPPNPTNNHQMYYTREFIPPGPGGGPGDTVIKLFNSPLVSPCVPNPRDCTATNEIPGLPLNTGSGGLEQTFSGSGNNRRLYGQEYIPAPMENFAQAAVQTPFALNLTTRGDAEKNTARWVLEIPAAALPVGDSMITVDTYIGSYNVLTGQLDSAPGEPPVAGGYSQPTDNSRTYVWRGANTWLYGPGGGAGGGGSLPITERFQILGDPRFCPYADLKKPHTNNAGAWPAANVNTQLGMGYNRYFDDFENTPDGNQIGMWPGWKYTAGGVNYGVKNDAVVNNGNWMTTNGRIEIDVPRLYQIFRNGLMFSNSVYTNMTGWPYFYMGIGNEIGYDSANGFNDNIPMARRPFHGTDAAGYFEEAITPGRDYGDTGNLVPPVPNPPNCISSANCTRASVKYIKEANDNWWALFWNGELYPDDMYNRPGPNNDWLENGNISPPDPTAGEASTAALRFLRVRRDLLPTNTAGNRTHTLGTTFMHTVRRTQDQGLPTFYWNGTTGVNVNSGSTNGTLAAGGTEINTTYNLPLDNPIAANRAFNSGMAAPATDGLGQSVYGANDAVTLLRQFYASDIAGMNASALYANREGATNRALYVVQNGLSPTGVSGTDFIARWSFLTLTQSFFEAGLFNSGNVPAVTQLPRVRITDPNPNTDLTNATNVTVTWAIQWTRWDGNKYTQAYPAGFTETTPLSYYIMYSADNGLTWKYIQDDSPAIPGTRIQPTDPRYASLRVTTLTTTWNASTKPEGAYILRVEAYRDLFPLHYAYHQYQAFITR